MLARMVRQMGARGRGRARIRVVLSVVTIGLAACSSAGSPAGSNASQAKQSPGVFPQLAQYISSLERRPTTLNITQPIGVPIPKGKVIAYVQCGSPACVVNGDALQQAAGTLGWTVKRINAGLTVQTIQAAWQQAVADHPDAVITSGTPKALFSTALAQLSAAKIPVIDMTTGDDPGNGLTAVYGYGPQWTKQGKILADYMLVNSGGRLNELSVSVSAYPNLKLISDAVTAEIKANCSRCQTSYLDVPVTSIGTDLPSRITNYLTAHPGVNWVYVGFADMMTGLPSALSAAGLSNVKIVTIDRTAASNEYMANNQNLVMTAGFDVSEMMWRAVDFLARTWTGRSTAQNTDVNGLPVWVITKANLPAADPTTGYFPYIPDYQSQYKKLWGVG